MVDGDLALLVCVSSDQAVREQVIRRFDDCGTVVLCADLAELRALLALSATVPPADFEPATAPTVPGPELVPLSAVAAVDPLPPAPRTLIAGGRPISVGGLTIDTDGHLVTWQGEPLALTRLERALLAHLAGPPVAVWTYERLFGSVWGGAYLGDTAILHSAMKRLRRKLRAAGDGPQVQTVRGVGYRLTVPA